MKSTLRPQRVLYVVSMFPALSETFIVREIRALIDSGVDVRIMSLKRPSTDLMQTDAAALLDRLQVPQQIGRALWNTLIATLTHPWQIAGAAAAIVAGTWRQPFALAKSLAAFARGLEHLAWVRQFDPCLIHAHWATYPSTVAWALARITERPFGFTSHAHDIFVNQQLLLKKLQDSALAVTISQHNVDWFDRSISSRAHEKLKIVHCGVDLENIPWEPEGRIENLILAVGRLHAIKGFDTLIHSLAKLRAKGVAFECRLIGDGPLREELLALVRSHGLQDRVKLLGAQPAEVVWASLQQAAVFALPCQVVAGGDRDGIPVALMEAMASGCTVVSCRVSGIPELITHDVDGILVPERDPDVLACELQRILGDAALRRRLAGAARKRIERDFDARKEAAKLHALMANALPPRSPKRLLVVIDEMEVGGSQRQIQHLLAGLDRRQWSPELAYFRNDSFMAEMIRLSGIPVHHLPKRHRIDLRFLFAFARLLRRGDYAIVHAYSLTAELWSMLARDLSGRRPLLIASERSFYRDKPAWHWLLKRIVLGRSAAVIANSRAGARSTARRTGMPAAMFATVANGVELPVTRFAGQRVATRGAIGVPEGRAMGLFVGRLVAVKNLPCLVRALAKLEPDQRPWIAVAGEGPLRESIQQFAAASGVANDLCLLGEQLDVTRLMQAADFLVLPSHLEGLSNALLEAMAAGCPVIASAVGGTPELIEDGATGLLFPADDANALAAAMARMAAEPALRAHLRKVARQHVEQNHSPSLLAAATSVVYERCLGEHPVSLEDRAATQPNLRTAVRNGP